jgi:hypothetical protein
MAVIKSGTSSDQLTIDAASKAARATLYNASGTAIGTETEPLSVHNVSGRAYVGLYLCSTWRTLGTAASPQNVASIYNPNGSGRSLAIRRISLQTDSTALLAAVPMVVKLSRPTALPTGGTVIPAEKFVVQDSNAVGVVLAGTASDGGAATAITATAGNTMWSQFIDRMHTAVGFIGHPDAFIVPEFTHAEPVILAPGEALLLQGVTAAANTTHFVVNFCWEEYTG